MVYHEGQRVAVQQSASRGSPAAGLHRPRPPAPKAGHNSLEMQIESLPNREGCNSPEKYADFQPAFTCSFVVLLCNKFNTDCLKQRQMDYKLCILSSLSYWVGVGFDPCLNYIYEI